MLTARGNGTINAEPNFLFDDATNTLSFLHQNSSTTNIEMGGNPPVSPSPGTGTVGQYTFIDMVGDDYYTDYGFRLLRNNNGKNSNSTIGHRGTGALELYCNEAGSVKVTAGDFRITNQFRGQLPANPLRQTSDPQTYSGSSTAGMRFVTNFYSQWNSNQSGYAIDTGISVRQSGGGGAMIVIYHHTASASQPSARMYFLTLTHSQGFSVMEVVGQDPDDDFNAIEPVGGGIGESSFSSSSQNTLKLTGSPGENYWHLIACGNLMF